MKNILASPVGTKIQNTAYLATQVQEIKGLVDGTIGKMREDKERVIVNRKKTDEIIKLCRASKNEDTRRYAELLEKTYDINTKDTWNEDAGPLLLQAVYDKELDIIKSLLAHPDILVNETDGELTALMWASGQDYPEAIELLLTHPDILVNKKNNEEVTPLVKACHLGHSEVVKLLLTHPDILVNEKNIICQTALMLAIGRGHEDIVKLLLRHPDILLNEEDKDKSSGARWTALIYATNVNRIDILEDLLDDFRMDVYAHDQLLHAYTLAQEREIKMFLKQKLDFYGIVV